jgi:hypothetical protein
MLTKHQDIIQNAKQEYVTRVTKLEDTFKEMLKTQDQEAVAKQAVELKRQVGKDVFNKIPDDLQWVVSDHWPTVEEYQAAGKSWDEILKASSSPHDMTWQDLDALTMGAEPSEAANILNAESPIPQPESSNPLNQEAPNSAASGASDVLQFEKLKDLWR